MPGNDRAGRLKDLRDVFRDEKGELSAGTKLLIILGIAAIAAYAIISVAYVKYTVTKGAQDAATAAATEYLSTRSVEASRRVAVSVAEQNGSDLGDFRVQGSKVYVRIDSRNRLESLAKISQIRHFIVTSATAEAEASRSAGGTAP